MVRWETIATSTRAHKVGMSWLEVGLRKRVAVVATRDSHDAHGADGGGGEECGHGIKDAVRDALDIVSLEVQSIPRDGLTDV